MDVGTPASRLRGQPGSPGRGAGTRTWGDHVRAAGVEVHRVAEVAAPGPLYTVSLSTSKLNACEAGDHSIPRAAEKQQRARAARLDPGTGRRGRADIALRPGGAHRAVRAEDPGWETVGVAAAVPGAPGSRVDARTRPR